MLCARGKASVSTPLLSSAADRLWLAWRAALVILLVTMHAPAQALDFKLWPLIDYHSEPGQRRLHVLGPIFSYETGPEQSALALRPLFALTRQQHGERRDFSLLYPLFVSHRDAEGRDDRVLLIRYRSENAARPDQWDRRFTIYPFVFYRYSHTLGTSLSVLPFYVNLRDFLGYERVRMILFPLFLRLEEPLLNRTWLPFPFVEWTGGTLGRGFRIFPVYGWEQEGETNRFEYIMWPFYVQQERHFTRPERERRLIFAPFYSRIDSPTQESRAYVGPFITHTIDRTANTETRGFPWPLWMSQYNLTTGERTGLRLAPFYEDMRSGNLHDHFVLWPLYRWKEQETDAYRYTRSDVMLMVYRNIHEQQPDYRRERWLRTLVPLYRYSAENESSEWSAPALFDAVFPRNPMIKLEYAPLWQLYTRQQDGTQPARWSLLWDLVSFDGTRVRYPVDVDFSE